MEASPERPGAGPRVQPLLLALLLLTLVTGLVDAACYLGLGRVFTANMTGNVVLLALSAAGAQGLPVLAPPCRWWCSWPAPVRHRWVMTALLAELGLVAVAGVVAVGLPVDAGGARRRTRTKPSGWAGRYRLQRRRAVPPAKGLTSLTRNVPATVGSTPDLACDRRDRTSLPQRSAMDMRG